MFDCYGGLLIEHEGTDQLRLQQDPMDSLWPGAQLAAEAQRMLEFVSADARGGS